MMRTRLLFFPLLFTLAACQTTMPQGPGAASDFYQRGRTALTLENYSEAIEHFEEAVRLDPRYGEAFYGLGEAYEGSGRDRLALDAYLDAIDVQPSLGKAQASAGRLYFERKEYNAAEAYLKRATTLVPADPNPYYYLGEIYRMQGKCKGSVDMYKKALAIKSNMLEAQEGLRRAQREVCRPRTSRTSTPASRPTYQKTDVFTGGGRALKSDEW
ncbi:tetratricopeptide repeat protein [Halochromatium sp.]|uniref:tetratricopeptide repeat protein n=1 Tax=Halochromatium sp. TaxID=2049430 RepID=UPI00397A3E08